MSVDGVEEENTAVESVGRKIFLFFFYLFIYLFFLSIFYLLEKKDQKCLLGLNFHQQYQKTYK